MCNFLIKTSLRGSLLLSLSLSLSLLLFILEITVIIPSISIFPLPSSIFSLLPPSTLRHACHCVTSVLPPRSFLQDRWLGFMMETAKSTTVSRSKKERGGGERRRREEGDDGGYVGRSPDVPSEREWDNILRDAQLTSDDCARWRKQYVSRYDLRLSSIDRDNAFRFRAARACSGNFTRISGSRNNRRFPRIRYLIF